MNVVYSFIGTLPAYSVETVYQLRLFYTGPVYFIVDHHESPYIPELEGLGVKIVNYEKVIDFEFLTLYGSNIDKFLKVPVLKERSLLFMRSFERFFLLKNLMVLEGLTDILFLELDNLVYDDPTKWLVAFQKSDMAYMFDNYDRASSGLSYVKNTDILSLFTQASSEFIQSSTEFMSEMTVLYRFYEAEKSRVQLLPIFWTDPKVPVQAYENSENYSGIFDAAAIGIYIGGMDTALTRGKVIPKAKMRFSHLDYSPYEMVFKEECGLRIPYILNNECNSWIRINNLHLHSKVFTQHLSKPMLE